MEPGYAKILARLRIRASTNIKTLLTVEGEVLKGLEGIANISFNALPSYSMDILAVYVNFQRKFFGNKYSDDPFNFAVLGMY